MIETAAPSDPYAAIRKKLKRMAPLVDLDKTLARPDVAVLDVRAPTGEVRGIAVILKETPILRLQLYFADDPQTARLLMMKLNEAEHDQNRRHHRRA
jgi:hypothetical protein